MIFGNIFNKPVLFFAQLNGFTSFQTIHFIISTFFFVFTQLNVETDLFPTIQFNISTV